MKQVAYLMANEPSVPSEGVSGTSAVPTGFDCIPEKGLEPATLRGKLDVLNCLVFETPHDFWVNSGNELKRRIDGPYQLEGSSEIAGPLNWLGYGDWECTLWADGPLPSCWKHDVAVASLQMFTGEADKGARADEAWNPRNKHLADAKAAADFKKHDCQMPTPAGRVFCALPSGSGFGSVAGIMHYGLNKINSPWPVTSHSIAHTEILPRFVTCDTPHVVPTPGTLSRTNRTVSVAWTYNPGCVQAITVNEYKFCWDLQTLGVTRSSCKRAEGTDTTSSFRVPWYLPFWDSVTLKTAAIKPNDIAYGSESILETIDDILSQILLRPFSQALSYIIDRIATGFYSEQELNLMVFND